jgi:hypothetical protein
MIKQNYLIDVVLSFPLWGGKNLKRFLSENVWRKGAEMKALQKNWLLPINCNSFLNINKMSIVLILFFIFTKLSNAQIANYINNGGFEVANANNQQRAKYWDAIDTNKYGGILLSEIISPYLVPASSFGYQWPRNGNNFLMSSLFYKPSTSQTGRGYPRNLLKGILQGGKTYCVKFHYCISNQSSFGIDGLGAYFGNNTLDTITKCDKPIVYLSPQIQNPTNNILSDTLNWSLLTGTFVANGTEKYTDKAPILRFGLVPNASRMYLSEVS